MNCIKCQNPLNDGAKFCRACGQNQTMPVDNAPPQNFQPQGGGFAGQQAAPGQKPTFDSAALKNKGQEFTNKGKGLIAQLKATGKFNAVAGGVAAVLVVGVFGATFLGSASGKVASAFVSTTNQLEKEYTSILEDLPVYDFFKSAEKDQFSLDYVSEVWYQPDFYLEMDWGKSQLLVESGTGDSKFTVHVSEKYTTVDGKMFNDVLGVENKTLGKDINNCDFLDIDISSDYAFEPFKIEQDLPWDLLDIFSDFCTDLIKGADVEKVDDETYRINGNRESLDTYEVTISSKEMESAMENAVKSLVKNKTIMSQLSQLYMLENYDSNRSLKDIEGLIEDEMYDFIDDFIDEYDDLKDNYFVVQLFKGKVVRMASPGKDGENISIMFTNTKELLEEVIITAYGREQTYSFASDGDSFSYKEVSYNGNTTKIDYNYDGRSDNVKINYGSYSETMTIDTTTKNQLVVEVEGEFEATFKKNSLSSGWFDQDTNFERILTYSERELSDIYK